MAHEQFEEAVALYAVNALEPAERRVLENHVREGCEDCRVALRECQAAAGLLPYALPPEAAPFDMQSHLMRIFELDFAQSGQAGAALDSGAGKGEPWRPFLTWRSLFGAPAFALASVLLLVVIGAYAVTLRSQLQAEATQRRQIELALKDENRRHADLQAQAMEQERKLNGIRNDLVDTLGITRDKLEAREAELAQLRASLAEQQLASSAIKKASGQGDAMAAFLRAPNIKVVSLTGSEEAQSAAGLVLFDPSSKRALLYAFNMPPLPAGKTYQLWAILDKPISAGTFGTDTGNKGRILTSRMPELSRIKKFAVSLEPEGGQPQPTGQIYLSGEL